MNETTFVFGEEGLGDDKVTKDKEGEGEVGMGSQGSQQKKKALGRLSRLYLICLVGNRC